MNFEEALVYELGTIEGLTDKIYPLNVTEGDEPPFVIYVSSEGNQNQTLEGFNELKSLTCEIHIVTATYASLKTYTKLVIDKLQTFYGRTIGVNGPVVRSFTMSEPVESHEEEVNYSRCSFDITVRI